MLFCDCFKINEEDFKENILPLDEIRDEFNHPNKDGALNGYELFCYENMQNPNLKLTISIEKHLKKMWNELSPNERKLWNEI